MAEKRIKDGIKNWIAGSSDGQFLFLRHRDAFFCCCWLRQKYRTLKWRKLRKKL